MPDNKNVSISFLGNASLDSRITNLTKSLEKDGYSVTVSSFDWFTPGFKTVRGKIAIHKLVKRSPTIFFYLSFAYLLINDLLKTKAGIYFAEDIYTLPFVFLIAKIKRGKIYYNSRELYAFLGGLRNRRRLQALITGIERFFIKRVDLVLTTGEMDSEFLEDFYGIKNTLVIRNIPALQKAEDKVDLRKMLNISPAKIILLYQGVILDGRGISLIFDALKAFPETVLVFLGDGVMKEKYKREAVQKGVIDRVYFAGMIKQTELINYTASADIGMALIENISVSYYHALPNKLFEYIMAELPILSCELPQMKKIVEEYRVGEAVNIEKPGIIIRTLQNWLNDKSILEEYKKNCKSASLELNWQAEYERTRDQLLNS